MGKRRRGRTRAFVVTVAACAALATSGGPLAASGPNLLRDGASFEVGVDGFSLNNYYLISHHGHEIQPVFDGTTAVQGKYSLRLDNPLGDKIVLTFRPIRLDRDAAVTVSGYLKGDGRARVQLMRWPFDTVASSDVQLSPDWRRFRFDGTIKNDQNYFLWILPTTDTRRIWLDALQMEAGPLSPFQPQALELAACTSAPYNTYWVGDACALKVRLYALRPPARIAVSVRVLDIFRKEVLRKAVSLPTKGRSHVNATIPLFRGDYRGSYKVSVEARAGDATAREVFTFGVLKRVTKPDPFFGFNLKQVFNEDAERRYSDNNEQRELVYANAPLEYTLGLMRRVGAGSLRCFRIAEYARIEKPSGEFVWRDTYVDLQKRAGLEGPLVVLAATGPEWDADRALPLGGHPRRGFLPRLDRWERYVRAMVSHYRGKVRYYEVVNEPETVFGDVGAYVERLKAAHDVIREADPEARIVAPSYSGGQPYRWLDQFCKAGGHRWVDIWAIHYAGRTLPERGMDRVTPTWELIRKYRQMLVEADGGRDRPFWNTEGGSFYWSPEYDHWPLAADQGYQDIGGEHYRVPTETLVAAYVPRLQLIEKCSGLDREYSFEFGFYYSQNASKATDVWSMYVNYDGSPSPALVTYNAVADYFAGARPVELLPLEHHVIVTLFQREGKTVGALWKAAPVNEYPGFERYDQPVWVEVGLKREALAIANMLGQPLTATRSGDGVRLTAKAFPVYFTTAMPAAEVATAFRSARLTLGPRPKVQAGAEQLMADRQYSAAVAVLQEQLARHPSHLASLEALGTCQVALTDYRQAIEAFTKALALDPESPAANRGMAQCLEDDNSSGLSWAERMARAAEHMGRAVRPAIERVNRDGKGSYGDLSDIYLYFYYLRGSTHVRGNASLALNLIDVARLIDPEAANFRTQRMIGAREELQRQAADGG
jgi:tetratricopeptide (TPR) repeat protein